MPSDRVLRTCALRCAAVTVALLLAGSVASAQTTLQWMQPAGSPPVSAFRIYKGPATDAGQVVYEGLPAPSAGVYAASVQIDEIDQGVPVYVWLTALNGAGESPPSNANFYPEGCDPLADSDCDGVPNTGSPGGTPCATGQTTGCDDNCPYWPNPGQEDVGGVGPLGSPPDGIGDVCQCGDVTDDGAVDLRDYYRLQRALLGNAILPAPQKCDVAGAAAPSCDLQDLYFVQRAVSTPATAALRQFCEPALAP